MPSRAMQLQLIDLLLPSLLASYNLPITVNLLACFLPFNFISGLLLWLHPSWGICPAICRRAATAADDKQLQLLVRYVCAGIMSVAVCGWVLRAHT